MGKFILVVLSLISFSAFAGPEEHISAQTCYYLNNADASAAAPSVPRSVCLESLSINPMSQAIYVYSYFQSNLFQNLKVNSLIRVTEDNYSFEAKSVLLNNWQSGCGDGESSVLEISGQTDFNGNADVTELNVRVKHTSTNDTCHSRPNVTEYTYTAY